MAETKISAREFNHLAFLPFILLYVSQIIKSWGTNNIRQMSGIFGFVENSLGIHVYEKYHKLLQHRTLCFIPGSYCAFCVDTAKWLLKLSSELYFSNVGILYHQGSIQPIAITYCLLRPKRAYFPYIFN